MVGEVCMILILIIFVIKAVKQKYTFTFVLHVCVLEMLASMLILGEEVFFFVIVN